MKHIPSILKCLFAFSLIGLGSASVLAENPPITPAWAFRHIVWEDEKNTTQAAEELTRLYLEHQIPVGGIIIDSPWSLVCYIPVVHVCNFPFPRMGIRARRRKRKKLQKRMTCAMVKRLDSAASR